MPTVARVLVVDDEAHIGELVGVALRFSGYEVTIAVNGRDALSEVRRNRPDLVVLDVMLPDLDGFDVARRIRETDGPADRMPVIFLTARDTTEDKIAGLRIGGDDYVTKPFSVEELLARVQAVLRRSAGSSPGDHRLTFADLTLDEETREVWRSDRRIELTLTEYRLLHYLLLNGRRVLTRSQILDHVWEYDFDGNASVLETYISYLRHKVDEGGPPLIHTVRGVGYTLREPRT
jgi:two-component system OmpR family response regulator